MTADTIFETDTAPPAAGLAFFVDQKPALATFLDDALTGLSAEPKQIAPKYFYDERGSELFDQICQTPEYYPTRTELGLLDRHGADIAAAVGPDCLVVEYGAGSSLKIRRLLGALDAPAGYVAVDISRDYLRAQMSGLARDLPSVPVGAICADFTKGFDLPPESAALGSRRLGFLPGSTIGNFTPADAVDFLSQARHTLGNESYLLIGVDLKKDPELLHQAYSDEKGITAAFNKNMLTRIHLRR